MSNFLSLLPAPVLENCSDQLNILGHTLTLRQGSAAAQVKPGLTKLRRHCLYTSQQVSKQHLELKEKQVYTSLLQVVENEKEKAGEAERELQQRRQTRRRQEKEIQQKTAKFKDLCRLDDKHHRTEEEEEEEEEEEVPQLIIPETAEKETEQQLQQKETNQAKKLLEDQVADEIRVHEAVKNVLQKQYEELEQLLQQWQHRTKQMLQETEQQLNSLCCKRTVNMDRLMEKRRQFRVMEQVMVEEKEEQEKLRQQQAEARAATKLQAWWRGCMVRRGLGSFKKADEDKKDKKKKKKEGKKKQKK